MPNILARTRWLLLFWLLSLVVFWQPLTALARLSLHDDPEYSYLILIPFITLFLIYLNKTRIFREPQYSFAIGIPLILAGVILRSQSNTLPLTIFAIVLTWTALFILCYGPRSAKAAIFPLSFLLLMIPPPPFLLSQVIVMLQKGSAGISYVLFQLAGEAVFRQGFRFSLPGIDIEIAEQCSSIHSATALFIVGLLAGHLFLQSGWRKLFLSASTIPIAMFTNAIRIVTLSLLAVHVNPDFLYGKLHRQGGILFSLISIVILAIELLVLRQSEARTDVSGSASHSRRPPSEPFQPPVISDPA